MTELEIIMQKMLHSRIVLPEFVKACDTEAEVVIFHQDAFSENELFLLGAVVKYAGLKGKTITVIP